jgi:hypothetical protein
VEVMSVAKSPAWPSVWLWSSVGTASDALPAMSATVNLNLSALSRLPPPPSPHRQVPIHKEEGRRGSGEKATPVRCQRRVCNAHLSLPARHLIALCQMVVLGPLTSLHTLLSREIKMRDHHASARRDRQISSPAQVIAAAK